MVEHKSAGEGGLLALQTGIFHEDSKAKEVGIPSRLSSRQSEKLKEYKNTEFIVIYKNRFCYRKHTHMHIYREWIGCK